MYVYRWKHTLTHKCTANGYTNVSKHTIYSLYKLCVMLLLDIGVNIRLYQLHIKHG